MVTMTTDQAEKNLDRYFTIKNRRCQVVSTATFSAVVHYGFVTVDAGEFLVGWIPADLIGRCETNK